MDKTTAINHIINFRKQLLEYPAFKGRAQIIKMYRKRVQFLTSFKFTAKEIQLLYNESLKEFEAGMVLASAKEKIDTVIDLPSLR